jgi:hypothetical protein
MQRQAASGVWAMAGALLRPATNSPAGFARQPCWQQPSRHTAADNVCPPPTGPSRYSTSSLQCLVQRGALPGCATLSPAGASSATAAQAVGQWPSTPRWAMRAPLQRQTCWRWLPTLTAAWVGARRRTCRWVTCVFGGSKAGPLYITGAGCLARCCLDAAVHRI